MLKETLQADLKEAMLSRDSEKVEVLKGLKSAILYAEVAEKKREAGLSDDEILAVFRKEAKKRQDSIDLYTQAGNVEMANKESAEQAIIEAYLPQLMDESTINAVIDQVIVDLTLEQPQKQDMGRIIGAVKSKTGTQADGALIAQLVQQRIR
jgi:uncharacterized protein YqeY